MLRIRHHLRVSDALTLIANRVRERITIDGVDLTENRDRAEHYVRDEVRRYSERALGGTLPPIGDEQLATKEVLAGIVGFGPIQPLLDDPTIEEIWINAPDRVHIARSGVSERVDITLTETGLKDLVERMLATSGRRIDLSNPFADASLPDGSRLHVASPAVTGRHLSVNIRKFMKRINSLARLVELGTLTDDSADYLAAAVGAGKNVLVTGATHSGKTTMLGALLATAGDNERIITVEETFELQISAIDHVALQCRQSSLEGTGEVTLRRLIKEALRMRPDRLVVGEVREAEALDLLIALNSGIPGMCSIHANSARDALRKLCTLPLLAGRNIDSSFVVPAVASCIDVVVFCRTTDSGDRRVHEIIELTGNIVDGEIETTPAFTMRAGSLSSSADNVEPVPEPNRALTPHSNLHTDAHQAQSLPFVRPTHHGFAAVNHR